ncbi:P-loop containing nucleoside triphosphate hydrolase protein [Crepidotus variabilis]|uniref:P-loop containing nucleoside triphosphate hydrolase protein n=1 Tax=Crepidotus variabilis TaxID=179855 RepID=A0A9P6EGZ7_9AGAR|nr:P-loop containing nucleoside triphosphate hydrolase protein [Crepidotus variabilis]
MDMAQQVFSLLNNNAPIAQSVMNCLNGTPELANATATMLPQMGATTSNFPKDLPSLITFFFSISALREWLKILVFGSCLESLRRLSLHLYYKIYNSFFITARFEEDDICYDWLCLWLSQQKTWKQARDVQVSNRTFGLDSDATMIEGEEDDPTSIVHGGRQLAYMPAANTVQTMWWKGTWIRTIRTQREGHYGRREDILELCILSRSHTVLNEILIAAKKTHREAQQNMISVYVSDSNNSWRHIASRPKRPLTSIILDPGLKDLLVDDARDFLASKKWYATRGIPFRRGYLLYGAPGSGKTSIIHSLAGELGLDVYVVSLSRSGLDDSALNELIADLPEKCIALMEDIDAAFSQTLNRDADESDDEDDAKKDKKQDPRHGSSTSKITLSGLLNALDGVAAQEGRILFATTNKYNSLDPALCRPGRMDIHIEFKLASKLQARDLFRCFYVPDSQVDVDNKDTSDTKTDSGYSSDSNDEKVHSKHTPISFNGETHHHTTKLSVKQIEALADQFAEAIPERECSMASLQGFLMGYKIRPRQAVLEATTWVEKERAAALAKKAKVVDVPQASVVATSS